MHYAACLMAAALVGIDMQVENAPDGRAETYVIGLRKTELELLDASLNRPEPPQQLSCGIDPTRPGGRFVRLYLRDAERVARGRESRPVDVELADGKAQGTLVYLVRLSRDDLADLDRGELLEATLPPTKTNRPTKFVVTIGPGSSRGPRDGVLADGVARPDRDAGLLERDLERERLARERLIRNPEFRDPMDNAEGGIGRDRAFEEPRVFDDARPGPGAGRVGRGTTLGATLSTSTPSPVMDYWRERRRASELEQSFPEEREPRGARNEAPVGPDRGRERSIVRRPSRDYDMEPFADEMDEPYSARGSRSFGFGSAGYVNRYDPQGYLNNLTVPTFAQPRGGPLGRMTSAGPGISRADLGAGEIRPNTGRTVVARPPVDDRDADVTGNGGVLTFAVLGLMLAIGLNVFQGWQQYASHMRYRDVLEQVRFGSWSNTSRTSNV